LFISIAECAHSFDMSFSLSGVSEKYCNKKESNLEYTSKYNLYVRQKVSSKNDNMKKILQTNKIRFVISQQSCVINILHFIVIKIANFKHKISNFSQTDVSKYH
jgi:hypothetical protein